LVSPWYSKWEGDEAGRKSNNTIADPFFHQLLTVFSMSLPVNSTYPASDCPVPAAATSFFILLVLGQVYTGTAQIFPPLDGKSPLDPSPLSYPKSKR
jgi:hypothetical protein